MDITTEQPCKFEALQGIRTLAKVRMRAMGGADTTSKHSLSLMTIAMTAFESGYFDEAVWYAEQAAAFNCRAFGLGHPWTMSSIESLDVLQQKAQEQRRRLRPLG